LHIIPVVNGRANGHDKRLPRAAHLRYPLRLRHHASRRLTARCGAVVVAVARRETRQLILKTGRVVTGHVITPIVAGLALLRPAGVCPARADGQHRAEDRIPTDRVCIKISLGDHSNGQRPHKRASRRATIRSSGLPSGPPSAYPARLSQASRLAHHCRAALSRSPCQSARLNTAR
jgi:hypothetical protein